jgi:hypothetical protein
VEEFKEKGRPDSKVRMGGYKPLMLKWLLLAHRLLAAIPLFDSLTEDSCNRVTIPSGMEQQMGIFSLQFITVP